MSTISLRISFLASALAFTFPAHATGTATHAMVVAGQAFGGVGPFGCATSGPQARESGFFNTGVGLPTEGYASCHLAGGIANDSHTFGPSFSDEAVTSAFNGGSATLSAKARADFARWASLPTAPIPGPPMALPIMAPKERLISPTR